MKTLLSLALAAFPRRFRSQFGDGMLDLLQRDYARARARGRVRALLFLTGAAASTLADGLSERLAPTWIDPGLPSGGWRWTVTRLIESWIRDFVHAARSLARAPGFALVVITTLALAIGANTAIFSVVNPVLLAPLPYPNADRLVSITATAPGTEQPDEFGIPDELYVEYLESARGLEDIAFYSTGSSTTTAEGHVEQLFLSSATASFFTTLGAEPHLGRLPTSADDDNVVVLSHWLWESWFGSNPDVVGRSYSFAREMRTVIGVMTPDFRFPDERVAFWIPGTILAAKVTPGGFSTRANVVARMAPGIDRAQLQAQLQPLARRVQERLVGPPPYARIMERLQPVVKPMREYLAGDVATPLWILLGTVGIVFLIACANVANLFTVRAENRRRDLAVRRALGAGRGDLVRAQVAEALLLAAAAGAVGAFIAWAGVPILARAAPDAFAGSFYGAPIPGLATARVDLMALLFTVALSVLAALAFGLLPAVRFSSAPRLGSLHQAGRGVVGTSLTRNALVIVQTASALVLLVGSALLVRSFWQLSQVDAGYDKTNIFTFQIAPTRPELKDRASVSRFQYAFMDRLAALPGVESVGFAETLPLDEGADDANVTTPEILASGVEAPRVRVTGAGGAYFQTMGIDLLDGRYFERVEEERGLPNVIISRLAAERLYPGQSPIGGRLRPASAQGDNWYTVIGVVEDILVDDLWDEPEPMVYLPAVALSPAYVLRSPRADALMPDVRALIREVIPESPMYRISTMERLAATRTASLSFTMWLVTVAAVLALVLGAVGLYGVLSYRVMRSAQEIGVRMALGAEGKSVRRMFVRQGARVAAIGVVIGVVTAYGLTRYIQTLLFGVEPLDVTTFAGMSAVMVAAALLASYIPALRASRIDPVVALRAD